MSVERVENRVYCLIVQRKPSDPRASRGNGTILGRLPTFTRELGDLGNASSEVTPYWLRPALLQDYRFESGSFSETFLNMVRGHYLFTGLDMVSRGTGFMGISVPDYKTFGLYSLQEEKPVLFATLEVAYREVPEAIFCLYSFTDRANPQRRVQVAFSAIAPWNDPVFEEVAKKVPFVRKNVGAEAASFMHTIQESLSEANSDLVESDPILFWLLGVNAQNHGAIEPVLAQSNEGKILCTQTQIGFLADLRRIARFEGDLRMVGIHDLEIQSIGTFMSVGEILGIRVTAGKARRWVKMHEEWNEQQLRNCDPAQLARVEDRLKLQKPMGGLPTYVV